MDVEGLELHGPVNKEIEPRVELAKLSEVGILQVITLCEHDAFLSKILNRLLVGDPCKWGFWPLDFDSKGLLFWDAVFLHMIKYVCNDGLQYVHHVGVICKIGLNIYRCKLGEVPHGMRLFGPVK